MGLTMKKILDKFSDCNKFSLTGNVSRYNITISNEEYQRKIEKLNPRERQKFQEQFIEKYIISEEEFLQALEKVEKHTKEIIYKNNKEKLANYPNFDEICNEIKQECCDFDNEENRQFYINKHLSDDKIKQYKDLGISEEEINNMKENLFRCSFIADHVGKTTKYGKKDSGVFWNLYHDIAMNIERKKDKSKYCINDGIDKEEAIPEELKPYFLYCEVSFFNSVTTRSRPMINYYFELNDNTKKYLLKFKNDFYIDRLEDLTLYKDDEIKFYSCTHERFNSINSDYKNMSKEELLDFISDELDEDCEANNNKIIIEVIEKLVKMEVDTKFSFKELEINDLIKMGKICTICDKLNLQLISFKNNELGISNINEDGKFKKLKELPAMFCDTFDIIEKKR